MNKFRYLAIFACLCAAACTGPEEIPTLPKIDRRPPVQSRPANAGIFPKAEFPDLRGADLSGLDLSGRKAELLRSRFDTVTRWPAALPEDFNPAAIMESGKNPGLGVRALHRQGIDGRGIGIGIVDQNLLTNHLEYSDRLRLYEELRPGGRADMHAPAVASIAAGKTAGVAPGADLYFISAFNPGPVYGLLCALPGIGDNFFSFSGPAAAIERLLDVNRGLPPGKKIRVISVSRGFDSRHWGWWKVDRAIRRARREGVFVITVTSERAYGFSLGGLGRHPLSDPQKPESFSPAHWLPRGWPAGSAERLYLPVDSRAYASPAGSEEFSFAYTGGMSWAVPYAAGLYALACQVRPEITPEEFLRAAMETADTVKIAGGAELKGVVNPTRLIGGFRAGGNYPTGTGRRE